MSNRWLARLRPLNLCDIAPLREVVPFPAFSTFHATAHEPRVSSVSRFERENAAVYGILKRQSRHSLFALDKRTFSSHEFLGENRPFQDTPVSLSPQPQKLPRIPAQTHAPILTRARD